MRKPLLVASVLVHAVAFTGLTVAAMWRIEKLPLQDHGGVVASFMLPKDTGGGAARPRVNLKPMDRPHKVVPKDTTQPEQIKKVADTTPAADPDTDVLGDSADGPPGNGTGGDGNGKLAPTGGCTVEPCTTTPPTSPIVPKPAEKPKKAETVTIPSTDARALRISGNDRIEAPSAVKVEMMRASDQKVIGTVKLCVDTRGDVARATLAKSTGYDAYDDKLVSEMRAWRYEALVKDGQATPFCTFVTLVYIMK